MKIDRSTLLPVIVAIVCVAGIGMVAATLTTADPIGADDDPILDPRGVDDVLVTGEGEELNQSQLEQEGGGGHAAGGVSDTITICVEPLDSTLGALAVILGVVLISALVYYRFNLAISLLVGWTIFPPVMLVYFLVTDCTVGASTFGAGGSGIGSDRAGDAIVPASELPPSIMVGLIGVVLVAAVVVMYRSAGEEDTVVPAEEPETDGPDLNQFAEAAGEAADRIEQRNVGVDNAVYRAWLEMTGLLDVDNPETYSAGDFADAAIELGMADDDVEELTTLFNEVRYGGMDAGAREDRAVEILRNIESEYGDVDMDPDDSTPSTDEEVLGNDDPAENDEKDGEDE